MPIIYITIIILLVFLGLGIIFFNHKSPLSYIFFVFLLGLSHWTFCVTKIFFGIPFGYPLSSLSINFYSRSSFIGPVLFPSLILLIALVYIKSPLLNKKWFWIFLCIPVLFIYSLLPTDYFISNLILDPPMFSRSQNFGYKFFFFYFLIFNLASFVYLLTYIITHKPRDKGLIVYTIFTFIGFSGGTITNLIIAAISGKAKMSWMGPFFGLFMLFGIFYAIIRHQFLGITITINHRLSIVIGVCMFGFFYCSGLFFLLKFLNTTISFSVFLYTLGMFVFGCLTFYTFRIGIQGITDRFFLKGPFPYKMAMDIFTNMLSRTKSVQDIIHTLRNFFVYQIGVSEIYLIVFDQYNNSLRSTIVWRYNDASTSGLSSEFCTDFPVEVYEQLKKGQNCPTPQLGDSSISDFLSSVQVIVPCICNNTMTSAIAFGPYSSHQPYSQLDYDLFRSLATQTAKILDLILSYDRVNQELFIKNQSNRPGTS